LGDALANAREPAKLAGCYLAPPVRLITSYPHMHIRRATADDAHRIATIHVEAWRAAYRGVVPDPVLQRQSVEKREAFWAKQLGSSSSHTLVAEEAGDVIGWIGFGTCRDADAPSDAEVYAVYLEPTWLRRGVGSALWRTMLDQVSRDGRRRVAVWVLADHHPARRFYEAMGGRLDEAKDKTERFGDVELREVRYWFECG
jgi:L-amino acid N-acyltransferase YncA